MYENDPLPDQVFHQLLDLMRIHRQYAHHIGEIKPRDLSVLRFLSEHEQVKVSQIQHYLHRSASTTSELVAKLEADGYVTRTRTSADRRVVYVALTPSGRDLLDRTPLGGMPLLRRELALLPPQRLNEMVSVLRDIRQLMVGEPA